MDMSAQSVRSPLPAAPGRACPRRFYVDLQTDAERKITEALEAVERVGADQRLTDASLLLLKARDRVADFVDGIK